MCKYCQEPFKKIENRFQIKQSSYCEGETWIRHEYELEIYTDDDYYCAGVIVACPKCGRDLQSDGYELVPAQED